MGMLARIGYAWVKWKSRYGLRDVAPAAGADRKQEALRVGVRGETYAYWYLRRHGYVMIARNFTYRGMKGEIDLVGYDGATVAFVEVKTRTAAGGEFGSPEEAVTHEKQRHLSRIARQFLREY